MIDSILVAMSGLNGHQRGLKVISNNVANMNTVGFKRQSVDFGDALGGDAGGTGRPASGDATGQGIGSTQTLLDLRAGDLRQTGRDLDLALQGNGFFVLQDARGEFHYTRAGAFEFDADGVLVARGETLQVMGNDASGKLGPIKIDGLRLSQPKATTEIQLTGNLSSTGTDHTIDSVAIQDKLGGTHTLRLQLQNNSATTPGSWSLTVFEGTTQIGSGEIKLDNGTVAAGSSSVSLTLDLDGAEAADITLKLGDDVTGFSSGTTSTLSVKSQDGRSAGQITTLKFDDVGLLKVAYSNGDAVDGARLVFAQVADESALSAEGDGLLRYSGRDAPVLREGGTDLKVTGQALEMSNVDLTDEFSALILMQRGYQASSQVLTTANDMLQELLNAKGRR